MEEKDKVKCPQCGHLIKVVWDDQPIVEVICPECKAEGTIFSGVHPNNIGETIRGLVAQYLGVEPDELGLMPMHSHELGATRVPVNSPGKPEIRTKYPSVRYRTPKGEISAEEVADFFGIDMNLLSSKDYFDAHFGD